MTNVGNSHACGHPKFKVGSFVSYHGPTFPWIYGKRLEVLSFEADNKAGWKYRVRAINSTRINNVWEKSLEHADAVNPVPSPVISVNKPVKKPSFALGARVKTLDGLKGIVKDILENEEYIVVMLTGERRSYGAGQLKHDVASLRSANPMQNMAALMDKEMTVNFIQAQARQKTAPAGLWHDGRKVRAAMPGPTMLRTTTLHTKVVRVVVAALPGALRYVP